MGKGNVDDPERDPALFPESRVRPWVVDEEADGKMQEMLDNLEKTMTFVSPIKDGLGVSSLDRTLLCDNRGQLFVKELAALEAAEKSKAATVASGTCGLGPIGEVFENLYRETHGLPRRKQKPDLCVSRGDSSAACLDDGNQGSVAYVATAAEEEAAAAAAAEEKRATPELQDGGEELAADPEVARLLSELQTELDGDGDGDDEHGSDAAGEEEGEGREEGEGGEGGKKNIENENNGNDSSSRECSEVEVAVKPEPENKKDSARLSPRAREQQQQQQSVEESLSTGPMEPKPQAEQSLQGGGQGRGGIDISRMKIDAPHPCRSRHRGGPRPRSAPSASLSAGGFSRLSSRGSSCSRMSRAVSQKLFQAVKEKAAEEERAAASHAAHGRGGGGDAEVEAALRQRSINVVKQTAEALQASLSVKRTSYLNVRQPSPARRSPPSPPPATRQRPKTAVAGRRRLPPDKRGPTTGHYGNSNSDNDNDDDNDNDNNHSSTPLLSQLEREFLFGAGAAKRVAADRSTAGADQDEVCNAPSMRKTTLGRLLRRSASSSLPTTTSTAPHHASPLSESSSVSSLFRRPLSAGGNGGPRADDHATGRRRRKPGRSVCFNNNRPSSSRGENAAVFGKARIRPASASAGSGRRRRGSPPFSAAAAAAGDLPCTQPDGVHRHPDRGRLSSSPYNRDNNNVRAGGAASAARSLASPGAAAATRARERETGLSEGTAAAAATGRVTRKPSLNIHQALEATIKAAIGVVSPREQFVNARRTIAEMKKINTKDSTGDMLLTTQGMTKARIAEECWSSEAGREYTVGEALVSGGGPGPTEARG